MAVTIPGGTPGTPSVGGGKTLIATVGVVRGRLHDELLPYAWDNDTLTQCVNETINELCTKVKMIEDAASAAICTHALLAGEYALTLSSRIVGINRAELASTGAVLTILDDVQDMDQYSSTWKTAAAGVPKFLIKGGLGSNVGRVWPASLAADSILLTVTRLPLADLIWSVDQQAVLPIEQIYHDKIYDGILAHAYQKADSDTENLNKSAEHRERWEKKIEEILELHKYKASVFQVAAPHPGWM